MTNPDAGGTPRIKSPQDFGGGLFLVAIGLLAFWFARDLNAGTLNAMGPGMLPKAFALILAVLGVLLVVESLKWDGHHLEGWALRNILFVLGGCLLFGLTIRGFEYGSLKVPALGLIVAGPLVMLVSGLAAEDGNWKELGLFALVMTVGCGLLFKFALGLPIPLAPWLIGV